MKRNDGFPNFNKVGSRAVTMGEKRHRCKAGVEVGRAARRKQLNAGKQSPGHDIVRCRGYGDSKIGALLLNKSWAKSLSSRPGQVNGDVSSQLRMTGLSTHRGSGKDIARRRRWACAYQNPPTGPTCDTRGRAITHHTNVPKTCALRNRQRAVL